MKGSEEFLDHLFQAARQEPVDTSVQDIQQLLDAAPSPGASTAAQQGGSSWWGQSSFLKLFSVVGVIGISAIAIWWFSSTEEVAETSAIAEVQPDDIEPSTPSNDEDSFVVPVVEEVLEENENLVVIENHPPADVVRKPRTSGQTTNQTNIQDPNTREPEYNNVAVSLEMPEEDPYSQSETSSESRNLVGGDLMYESSLLLKSYSDELISGVQKEVKKWGVTLKVENVKRRRWGKHKIKSLDLIIINDSTQQTQTYERIKMHKMCTFYKQASESTQLSAFKVIMHKRRMSFDLIPSEKDSVQ